MQVGLTLTDSFLQNGLERLVDSLYLSIFLGVVRGRMTMLKPHLRCYLFHHFILKVTSMISNNITWDSETGNNLIEYEEGDSPPVGFKYRHGINPLSKLVDNHDNVSMPLD